MVLLCLHWGADPNAVMNANRDTPLLRLLKSDQGASSKSYNYVRLLLRFGANPSCVDSQGNNALHILATSSDFNLYVGHEIYRAGGIAASKQENLAGQTPYQLASKQQLFGQLAKNKDFLFDEMLFDALPFHFPTIVASLIVISAFVCLAKWRFLWGGLIWFCFYYFFLNNFLQIKIIQYRHRVACGVTFGMIFIFICTFVFFTLKFLSLFTKIFGFIFASAAIFYAVKFFLSRPNVLNPLDKLEQMK